LEKQRYIHSSAVVMGEVNLGDKVNIWPTAVLRGDLAPITVGDCTNIQEGSILHTDKDLPLEVAANVTIGHRVVLHSCTVGENSLIGIGAIVLNGVRIGKNCMIAAGSLISPNKEIPNNSLVMGSPGRIIRTLTQEEILHLHQSPKTYWELALTQMKKEQA
jgi:carbonic anhydrase/acetyltransferase-like protein (isoleucine patch superfamily)